MDCALDCQTLQITSLFIIIDRMDINNNVTVPQSSDTLDGKKTASRFFKILWQGHPVTRRTNLKDVLEFRVIHAPVVSSSVHINRCVYYSRAKSFVNNGRRESFLE